MVIPVLVEPNYAGAIWVRQMLDGIAAEAQRRKYRTVIPDAEQYEQLDYDELFGEGRRLVILAAASESYVPKVMRFLAGKGIDVLLVNDGAEEGSDAPGLIRMNYETAAIALLQYLWDCGKRRIALYGVNPSSSSDHNKLLAYEKWHQQHRNQQCGTVFYNYASLADCYRSVGSALHRFDAVICVNNIVAASFVQHALADGIAIPEDLYVAAMTDSLLLQRLPVPVTAVSPDYRKIGAQAVMLYAFLCHQKEKNRVSVRIPFCFSVRESTGMTPRRTESGEPAPDMADAVPELDFYSDPEVPLFSKADRLLNICDETDLCLIRGLLAGDTYEAISQSTFLAIDSVKYRKKRMMKAVSCETPEDFLRLLRFCAGLNIL